MKKIVRLTESDIVRLVKKVIVENKKLVTENPAYIGSINNNVQNLKAVQWQPQIEVEHKNGFKNKVNVLATISKGGFNIMSNKPVNLYDMYGDGKGGVIAQIVTGDCGKIKVPACLSTVQLNQSETYSLSQHLKDFKQFNITKDNVEADIPGVGKVSVKVELKIG